MPLGVRTPGTHTKISGKKIFGDDLKTFSLHACFHFFVVVLIQEFLYLGIHTYISMNLFGFCEAAVFVPFKHSLSSMGTSTLTVSTKSILRRDRINEQTERKQSNFKINYLLSTLAMTKTKQEKKTKQINESWGVHRGVCFVLFCRAFCFSFLFVLQLQ